MARLTGSPFNNREVGVVDTITLADSSDLFRFLALVGWETGLILESYTSDFCLQEILSSITQVPEW